MRELRRIINKCFDCPYYNIDCGWDGCCEHDNLPPDSKITNPDKIPEWCPLPLPLR